MQSPNTRCGYVADPESVSGRIGRWCCRRPVWKDRDRCLWHVDEAGKSLSTLQASDASRKERLDGAVLRSAESENGHAEQSFSGCTLIGADCANASFEGVEFGSAALADADLSDADLGDVDLSGTNLRNADLTGANLRNADLSGADLTDAVLVEANLSSADLSEATGRYTDFTGANLRDADLSDATLSHASFEGATMRRAVGVGAVLRRADFSDADLFDVEFTDANLRRSSLGGVDLENSRLSGANLESAGLRDSVLFNADLDGAELFNANLTDVNARNASFEDADLEDATLNRTELRDADLLGARLYQAVFADTRINNDTEFGRRCAYETDPGADVRTADGRIHRLVAAAWTYRRLERIHDENAMADEARRFHIRKKEVQRAHDREQGRWSRFAVATTNRYLTNHGESLRHIIYSSAAAILLAGVLYPFLGGISDGNAVYRLTFAELASTESLPTLLRSLYFSIITFTTIGYGNVYPLGNGSRILVGVESLLGALLMALFVFVLGRRVAR